MIRRAEKTNRDGLRILQIVPTPQRTRLVVTMAGIKALLPSLFVEADEYLPKVLADKFDKTVMIRLVKNLEIAVMAVAAWGFWTDNVVVLLLCVVLGIALAAWALTKSTEAAATIPPATATRARQWWRH